MKIVLFGYMGSGKSSVGKQLASTLNYNCIDLDSEIEKREDKTISEVFNEKGEIYFRNIEKEILQDLISSPEKLVIATGGGTPCYGDTTTFLSTQPNVITIYLQTSLEVLTTRLYSEKAHRPLIAHLQTEAVLKDFIRKHLFERSHYYTQATFTVNTGEAGVQEIVAKIIVLLF
ncbi:shikimate kinase [Ulvibacter sp. MAR_2010_11]|uniref:shikimate kinase n=1 Tax=Ulvibacter sp. MAR_2010_11 TaxID=1250229 RepID=UPI000C2B7244|nr:shikimate kinase [Ulvibacter sp. MAR_2010_11]PKA81953.1 shikimate kinase [Ulvibacter sp. MAR_2010_11]